MFDGNLTTEQRNTLVRREASSEVYLPFLGPVRKKWARLTKHGSVVATLALGGWAWEALDDPGINSLDTRLQQLSRTIASDRVVLTTHLVRSLADASEYPEGQFRSEFSRALDASYREHLVNGRLYRNDLFLSVELRPAKVSKAGIMARLGFTASQPDETIEDMVNRLDGYLQDIERQLHDCSTRRLGIRYERRFAYDEMAEAFYSVLYGERRRIPLVTGSMGGSLHQERVRFTWESVDIFGDGPVRHAAIFGLKGYPSGGRIDDDDPFPGGTMPGQFDRLLVAPYSFTLKQSFGFLSRDSALSLMKTTKNQLHNARDQAVSQAAALGAASDMVAGNHVHMGSHDLSLMVFAPTKRDLLWVAAQARSDLAECGVVAVRENLALEGAFWSQLPANDKWRARPAVISSEAFWHMSPLHNYPVGKTEGYWGAPVALVRATGGTPYRLHLHDGDLGNAYIVGPSGSGKTTLLGFLLSQSEKTGAKSIVFDKDEGLRLTVLAMEGSYSQLKVGEPTGISILKALDNTPSNITHLISLLRAMIMWGDDTYRMNPDDDERLAVGVDGMMLLRPEDRSLSELCPALGVSDAEGAGARLRKWCWGEELGWALDCPEDTVSFDAPVVGFDLTTILDHPAARGPIMAHLFHRSEALLDGQRVITWWDEFWRALLDPLCADMIQNALKTRRKLNSPVILATQSARDMLKAPISRSIIEQCATAFYTPNPRADYDDYVVGLKRSETEFRIISEDMVGQRKFLFTQGETSISCDLDLEDLPAYVAVLSGRRGTVKLAERLMQERGKAWLPEFMARWREAVE